MLTESEKTDLANIGLIRSIDIMLGKIKPGRLKGRITKVIKTCDRLRLFYPDITDEKDFAEISKLYDHFLDQAGWKNGKHLVTVISCLSKIAEKMRPENIKKPAGIAKNYIYIEGINLSYLPADIKAWHKLELLDLLLQYLTDIFLYFEKGNKAPYPCIWGGKGL